MQAMGEMAAKALGVKVLVAKGKQKKAEDTPKRLVTDDGTEFKERQQELDKQRAEPEPHVGGGRP